MVLNQHDDSILKPVDHFQRHVIYNHRSSLIRTHQFVEHRANNIVDCISKILLFVVLEFIKDIWIQDLVVNVFYFSGDVVLVDDLNTTRIDILQHVQESILLNVNKAIFDFMVIFGFIDVVRILIEVNLIMVIQIIGAQIA